MQTARGVDRKEFALLLSGITTHKGAGNPGTWDMKLTGAGIAGITDAEELKAPPVPALRHTHDRESLEEACMKQYTAGRSMSSS